VGLWMAVRVQMTGMPEMVALLNGLGGAASALVALSEGIERATSADVPDDLLTRAVLFTAIGLSALVGWMTLTGSILAMFKLKEGVTIFGRWYRTPTWGPRWLNAVKLLLMLATAAFVVMGVVDP